MSAAEVTPDRLRHALEMLDRLEDGASAKVTANLDAMSDDFAEIVLGFAFTDVLARPAIDLRTREMLTVAALTAMGTAPGQLEFHIRAACNTGVTREEVVEIVLQMAVYAGVPACMNGVAAARRAFAALDATAEEGPSGTG
ncbi:carboxymuconolactone decarboxylase [Rhodobacteraceae bacterium CCMM004]|nr:carboxymuconolactone decarboxylase [Rhodobacteraceae bacterium CCMM004]